MKQKLIGSNRQPPHDIAGTEGARLADDGPGGVQLVPDVVKVMASYLRLK